MRYRDRPAVIEAATKRYAAKLAAGALRCSCNALADPANRHGGHAPDCDLELAWPDILEDTADRAYEADLAKAEADIPALPPLE